MKLQHEPGVSLYFQVKSQLKDNIAKKLWRPGDKIPNELDLTETFGVSRSTVRQAVLELVREGYLTRKNGIGTFVTQLKYDAPSFISFHYPPELGYKHILIKQEIIRAFDGISKELALEEGEEVYKILRLRYFNEEPAVIETAYLSVKKFPNLLRCDLTKKIFDVLAENYNVLITNFDTTIEPVLLNNAEKKLFKYNNKEIAIGLHIVRICCDDNKEPFLINGAVFRKDYCKLIFSSPNNLVK